MKIGLGTAQFGMEYGISNKTGKVFEKEVEKILNFAFEQKVDTIDTAYHYGSSELVIGKYLNKYGSGFKVVTKTVKFESEITVKSASLLQKSFYESLKRLKIDSVYGLMIHNVDDLLKKNSSLLFDKMLELKNMGLVKKIGISVYTPSQLIQIFSKYNLDLVQLPLNVLDQRFLGEDIFHFLKQKNVEIHARSVFLQGLLLMQLEYIPKYFNNIRHVLDDYHKFLSLNKLSLLDGALGFVSKISDVDKLIIGTCSEEQLRQIIDVVKKNNNCDSENTSTKEFKQFACRDERFINPANWNIV